MSQRRSYCAFLGWFVSRRKLFGRHRRGRPALERSLAPARMALRKHRRYESGHQVRAGVECFLEAIDGHGLAEVSQRLGRFLAYQVLSWAQVVIDYRFVVAGKMAADFVQSHGLSFDLWQSGILHEKGRQLSEKLPAPEVETPLRTGTHENQSGLSAGLAGTPGRAIGPPRSSSARLSIDFSMAVFWPSNVLTKASCWRFWASRLSLC